MCFLYFYCHKIFEFQKRYANKFGWKNQKKLDCKKTESFYATEKTMLTHPKTSLGLDLP